MNATINFMPEMNATIKYNIKLIKILEQYETDLHDLQLKHIAKKKIIEAENPNEIFYHGDELTIKLYHKLIDANHSIIDNKKIIIATKYIEIYYDGKKKMNPITI